MLVELYDNERLFREILRTDVTYRYPTLESCKDMTQTNEDDNLSISLGPEFRNRKAKMPIKIH